MEYAHLSQQDFAARLGISPASLSSIFTGRTNPTNNHVSAIHRAFPEINVNWMMFGEGEMISPSAANQGAQTVETVAENGTLNTEEAPLRMSIEADRTPSLFDQEPTPTIQPHSPVVRSPYSPQSSSAAQRNHPQVANIAMNVERPPRKVKEIRVFFDDGTYESFVPSGK